jgi:hypothetical protein
MAKSFTNWSQIEVYLQEKLNDCLQKEVAETVKDELQSSISEVVYGAGTPTKYIRRGFGENGGIADKSSMTTELVSNGTITITPDAERNKGFSNYPGSGYDSDKSLAFNLEMGYGDKQQWFNQPRSFVQETKDNLKQNKVHVESLRDALIKRGLDVL